MELRCTLIIVVRPQWLITDDVRRTGSRDLPVGLRLSEPWASRDALHLGVASTPGRGHIRLSVRQPRFC